MKLVNDINTLKGIVDKLKQAGKKIVFTNGCFDVLHVGHIRSLQDAKSRGDILIVGVNDDMSVKKLKGTNHPLYPQEERVEILEALDCVDYIVLFSEPTADQLLTLLKPNIHAKGTDYTKETVPERDTVLSFGGEIAIVGDQKSHSSSEIKRQLRGK